MKNAFGVSRAAAAGLLWIAATTLTPAVAATIFEDNFDTETLGLNYAGFANWDVTDGTVDLIGAGFFDLIPGNGRYVDLDGSTSNAGVLTTKTSFLFEAGQTYVLTFDLAGNQRGGANDLVTVVLGSFVNEVFDLASAVPFTTVNRVFTPGADTTAALSFSNAGGDNVGALLDRVRIESDDDGGAIPEPATLALFGLALCALHLARRRRA
jgi:PEP-CTERM motif